ncbi:MAG: T9SS type A sorting domain-containing protein [Bacteroidia bacterium]
MNKNLLLLIGIILSIWHTGYSKTTSSLSVSVQSLTADWCGNSTGSLQADVSGGTGPYNYSWNVGATSSTLTGLSTGQYDVTVTDQLGAQAFASGFVGYSAQPQFYAISIVMPQQNDSDGSVQVAQYPNNGSGEIYLPDGTYYYDLSDSNSILIASYSYTIPGVYDVFHTFDSLPRGHYSIMCSASFGLGGCTTTVDFDLKEIPAINPAITALPSCNGSPTGTAIINLHPSPAITANTFISNIVSFGLFPPDPVTSKYKAIVYDASNNVNAYYRTQDSIFTMSGLLPGLYTLNIYTGDTVDPFTVGNHDSVLVYTGNFNILNDTLCSLVKGRLFADYNNNCSYDGGDIVLAGTLIELNPGAYSAITNSSGEYYIPVPVGVYTLKQYAPYQYAQLCPDTNTFNINVSSTGLIIDVQLADSINVNPDVQIGMYASQPRPGFNQNITITYRNLTPNLIPAQTVTLNYDSNLIYVSSSPIYTTASLGQLIWNAGAIGPFGQRIYHVTLNVPSTTAIGTVLNATAVVSGVTGETNIANNSDSISQTVTGAYDPNDIAVDPVGFGTQGYITNFENLKYTIRFQNTGNDTAFTVIVTDTLPASLDKYSLQVLSASNDYWYEFKTSNVVLFHFDNILLPDSNVNEEASHGFIKYSIAQSPGNTAGTLIENNAGIYFDFNAPVITNTVENTIYDCNQMATSTINNSSICEGDSISATSTLLFNMNSSWYLDSVFYSSDSSIVLSNLSVGLHQLKFIASNSSCSQEIISNLIVNALPPKPTIVTVNSPVLGSSSSSGNQWLENGSVIIGATDTIYNVVSNGWYAVMVTDANGCSSISDSVLVIVEGIKDLQNSIGFKLIPNPANEKVQVSFQKKLFVSTINVTDILGNVIITVQPNSYLESTDVDIKNLKQGVYFIVAKSNSETFTSKLIKL